MNNPTDREGISLLPTSSLAAADETLPTVRSVTTSYTHTPFLPRSNTLLLLCLTSPKPCKYNLLASLHLCNTKLTTIYKNIRVLRHEVPHLFISRDLWILQIEDQHSCMEWTNGVKYYSNFHGSTVVSINEKRFKKQSCIHCFFYRQTQHPQS